MALYPDRFVVGRTMAWDDRAWWIRRWRCITRFESRRQNDPALVFDTTITAPAGRGSGHAPRVGEREVRIAMAIKPAAAPINEAGRPQSETR